MSTPTGQVTFLLTDIEGSSWLWEMHPEAMSKALAEHDRRLLNAIAAYDGHVFGTAGDSFAAAFHRPVDAVQAAVTGQRALAGIHVEEHPLRTRMALHFGKAEEREGDYYGRTLNRCGRLRDAAHGGQIVVSASMFEELQEKLEGIELVDLGEHRLRDLEDSEHIFQLQQEGLPTSFPPLRTLSPRTSNLPVQLAEFIGRNDELKQLVDMVLGSRLVTLTGPGGSGKTRLALQIAGLMSAEEFPQGIWLIELGSITEPDLVVQHVAAVLGVREKGSRTLFDNLIEAASSRRMLLILDNCEHLLNPVCRLVTSLLQATTATKIVATSREALGLAGEVIHQVPPLQLPSVDTIDVDRMVESDSVRLFVSRGACARPGFTVTASNAESVAAICRRLDGLPLAIELAAARLASLSPEQIAGHLDHRFRLLSTGHRGVPARHETLESTIDWSYNLLNPREQRLFRALAVFRGDFTLDAAQRIAADDIDPIELLVLLPRLVDKSLVQADPLDGTMRYRLLETIREYASDRLRYEEKQRMAVNHTAYFLGLARERVAQLASAKHEEAMADLTLEQGNFRQALRTCLDSNEIEAGLRLAGTLYRFWLFNEHPSEGVSWIEAFLGRHGEVDGLIRARALLGFGSLVDTLLDTPHSGVKALREAVELYRRTSGGTLDPDYAVALNNLAFSHLARGELEQAELTYEDALEVSRALDRRWTVAIILGNLGTVMALRGESGKARARLDESVDVAVRIGAPRLLGDALRARAAFERDFGNTDQAVLAYEKSIAAYLAGGYTHSAQLMSADMAATLARSGDLQAEDLFLVNAAAVLSEPEMSKEIDVIIDLSLGRAELDLALGDSEHAARLVGFVGVNKHGDTLAWSRSLVQRVRDSLGPDEFEKVVSLGSTIPLDSVRTMITED